MIFFLLIAIVMLILILDTLYRFDLFAILLLKDYNL